MKKPQDVADLANRLAKAASTPLVAPPPISQAYSAEEQDSAPAAGKRKSPARSTIPVFLRLSKDLYDQYDGEAVRRTKATGRGVTVQQVILDRLAAETHA
jgi:hypothetical protein